MQSPAVDTGTASRGNQTETVSWKAGWVTVGNLRGQTSREGNRQANEVQTIGRSIVIQADSATDKQNNANARYRRIVVAQHSWQEAVRLGKSVW